MHVHIALYNKKKICKNTSNKICQFKFTKNPRFSRNISHLLSFCAFDSVAHFIGGDGGCGLSVCRGDAVGVFGLHCFGPADELVELILPIRTKIQLKS